MTDGTFRTYSFEAALHTMHTVRRNRHVEYFLYIMFSLCVSRVAMLLRDGRTAGKSLVIALRTCLIHLVSRTLRMRRAVSFIGPEY